VGYRVISFWEAVELGIRDSSALKTYDFVLLKDGTMLDIEYFRKQCLRKKAFNELMDFAKWLYEQGYKETTIATIVHAVHDVIKDPGRIRKLEERGAVYARTLRYAWRIYKKYTSERIVKEASGGL
jgi:hypothetical protein